MVVVVELDEAAEDVPFVVVDDVLAAEVVAVDVVGIGNVWLPIVILVSGAFPKLKVAEVALEDTLTACVLPAVNVPCQTVLPPDVTETQALAALFNLTVLVAGAFFMS